MPLKMFYDSKYLTSRENLINLLDGLEISERELARRSGLGHATINHLVTGRRSYVRSSTADAIERAFGVESGRLFTAVERVHA